MSSRTRKTCVLAAAVVGLTVGVASTTRAAEVTIPRGTPVDVLVEDALSSRTARVGDEFRAVLIRALWIDGRLALPRGTVVEGRVEVVRSRAAGDRSGFVGVKFVRLELPDASGVPRLAEFGAKPDRVDVVLIGRVVSNAQRPSAKVAAAEHAKEDERFQKSESDVEVAAGTLVSLEFNDAVNVPGVMSSLLPPASAEPVLVPEAVVAAAQRALREQGTYAGAIDGMMSTETRHALIRFQLSRGRLPTGWLDGETIRLLEAGPSPAP